MFFRTKKEKKSDVEDWLCSNNHKLRKCPKCGAVGCAAAGCVHQGFRVIPQGERCRSCSKIVKAEVLKG